MNRFLKPKYIPAFVLSCGIVGMALRMWLFSAGIDGRGLILAAHPANNLVFILTAIVLGALYFCLPKAEIDAGKYHTPSSLTAAIGCWIAALGIAITELSDLSGLQDKVGILNFILGLASTAALVMLGLCRAKGTKPNILLHSCVTIYLMVHLISQYRLWSAEPQLQLYVFQLLASIFMMLGLYHRTTLDDGNGSRRWYRFFRYGGLFFCFLAAIGGDSVFYLSMALWTALGIGIDKITEPAEKMYLPKNVQYCLQKLEDAGYKAYAVGGCVRDSLLGLTPQDYDMCTSATPEQTARIFAQHALVRSGEKHGTIGVILDSEVYEITTFRTEGGYTDSRHPDWVAFVTDVKEDLARRDFTVNAMAYSPTEGYIDPFGGQEDLKNHVLRTVGLPEERFEEDALRILRGMRFAARFNLTPVAETEKAMTQMSYLIAYLAPERILSELCKLLPFVTAQDLIRYAALVTRIIPELSNSIGFDQRSPHHAYDVYTHTAHTVEATPPDVALRLAALLHDVAKPSVFSQDENGRGHFYDHAKVGAETADRILLRLRASNALRAEVVFLIEHHMTPFEPDKKLLRRRLGKYGSDAVKKLLALQKADYASKGVTEEEETNFEQIEILLDEIIAEGACLTAKDLAVNGNDLLTLGVQPGKIVGDCMAFLLQMVQDELIANTKEELLNAAKEFFAHNQEESV